MEKFKLILISLLTLALLGFMGFWSFNTLQSGSEYSASEKLKQLQDENEDLKKQVEALSSENRALQPKVVEPVPAENKPAAPTTYKYQSVINELEELVARNVFLKLNSRSTAVGTVQKFLNVYNDASNKIDNDYGASTKAAVAVFQKAEGLSADGEAGKSTFNKMIEWLETQS